MTLRNVLMVPIGAVVALLGAQATQQEINVSEEFETVVKKTKAPEPQYVFDRGVGKGRIVKKQFHIDGQITETYSVKRDESGKIIERTLVSTETVEAQPAIFAIGSQGYKTSRGTFVRRNVKVMEATAYDPSAGRGKYATFKTATGIRAKYGVIAVDPRVIPLNTFVYVEGYGFAKAADTGGAIKGNRIDVCVPTNAEARKWGRKKVRVHILK